MKLGRKCGIQTWTAFKHITWSLYNCRCKMLHIMAGMREWNDFIYNEISASYQPFPFFKNNTTIINNRGKWWLRQVCQGYLINHKKIWYVLILSQSLDFNFHICCLIYEQITLEKTKVYISCSYHYPFGGLNFLFQWRNSLEFINRICNFIHMVEISNKKWSRKFSMPGI